MVSNETDESRRPAQNFSDQAVPSLLEQIRHGRLVGRDSEIAEAQVWLRRAFTREGSTLLVSGEPGIGKSRFSQELVRHAQDIGYLTFLGSCYAESGSPYGTLTQMVHTTLRLNPSSQHLLPEFPFTIFSVDSSDAAVYRSLASPVLEYQRVFDAVGAWLEQVCAVKPVLMVLEDVHWAGSAILELLRHLARMARHLPLVISMTFRPGEIGYPRVLDEILLELNRERLAVSIPLKRLNQAETQLLLSSISIKNITPAFIENLHRQTEGNPFFVEEVCKALIEEGHLINHAGQWHIAEAAVIIIPRSVRSAIQARVGRLSVEAQEILRLAAIQGHVFDYAVLKQSSSQKEEVIVQALEEAVSAVLIDEIEAGQGEPVRFRFVHVLIPVTLRESMIRPRRLHLHRQVAQAIEVVYPNEFEVLAHHYAESVDEEPARLYAIRAANRLQKMAPAEAARFYRAALVRWSDEDLLGRADLLAKLGYCLWITADTKAAKQVFMEAYALFDAMGEVTQSGEMQRMVGRIYWEEADRAEALVHYRLALALHEQRPGTVEQARAISSISQMHMLADENDQAIQWGRQALELAQRLGAEDVCVHALNNIGCGLVNNGDVQAGFPYLQESLDRSLAAGLPSDALRAYFNLTGILHRMSQYVEELHMIEQMTQLAKKVYAQNYIYLAFQRLCWVNWLIGKWGDSLRYRALVGESRSPLYTAWTLRMFAEIDIDLGRYELAKRALEEGQDSARKANEMQTTVPHLYQLGRVYNALGDHVEAGHQVQKMMNFLNDNQVYSEEGVMPILFCVQWLVEQPDERSLEKANICRNFLQRSLEISRSPEAEAGTTEADGCICLAEEKPQAAAVHFQQAARLWEKIDRRYDQARALTSLGQAWKAAGKLPAARAALKQASSIFNELAHQLDGDTQRTFLETTQVALARQMQPDVEVDWDGLSRREVQVAQLIWQGRSNREIAGEMVISERTVEKHVENIMNRLGYHSRVQIAAWIASKKFDQREDG